VNRVLLLVEGSTEERFVKTVVQPHLWNYNVSLQPKIVMTKRAIGATSFKGGGDFSKIAADIRRLLGDTDASAVTTLFDFYGFPTNVPGAVAATFDDVDRLERAFAAAVADERFRPYLQRHEFEAFLFIDPELTAHAALNAAKAAQVAAHCSGFTCVEDINNDPMTAPSKRLQKALGSYSKPLLGSAVTSRLGIERIRAGAPRFSSWLTWLEQLGRVR
jgi:hypothetical protein